MKPSGVWQSSNVQRWSEKHHLVAGGDKEALRAAPRRDLLLGVLREPDPGYDHLQQADKIGTAASFVQDLQAVSELQAQKCVKTQAEASKLPKDEGWHRRFSSLRMAAIAQRPQCGKRACTS